MKTIEERAFDIAKEFGSKKSNKVRAIYRACVRMAIEQQKIDFEQACEWLKARNVMTEASLEGFRKAMEE